MSMVMEEDVKRWKARPKSVLNLKIIQSKTTIAEAARPYDSTLSGINKCIDQGKASMGNVLMTKPEDIRKRNGRQLKDLQVA